MKGFEQYRNLDDDGLHTPEVGAWAEKKYQLLYTYSHMFARSMKQKWQRVYVDLFSASGRSRIRGTDRIVLASPLLALEVPDKFDRYIFCEQDESLIGALKLRVARNYPNVDVRFIEGDVNQLINEVINDLPPINRDNKILGFCFVDPCGMKNIQFKTIRRLATRFMDFLILIPTDMDAIRNVALYTSNSNPTVDNFVDTSEWRKEWSKAQSQNVGFDIFIARYFSEQMKILDYRFGGLDESVLIRSSEKNLRLYRLGFYSRHPLGGKFWEEAKKSSMDQRSLFD